MEKLAFSFDLPHRWLKVVYFGQPSADEVQEVFLKAFSDARFAGDMNVLIDREQITESPSSDYVRAMVRFVDAHQRPGHLRKWAIVGNSDVLFGMGRMAEQLSQFPESIRVFRSLKEAQQWLGE